jgi:hypothetical protein
MPFRHSFSTAGERIIEKRVAVEFIYLQGYFNNLTKSLLPYPRLTPSEEVTYIRLGVSIDATP